MSTRLRPNLSASNRKRKRPRRPLLRDIIELRIMPESLDKTRLQPGHYSPSVIVKYVRENGQRELLLPITAMWTTCDSSNRLTHCLIDYIFVYQVIYLNTVAFKPLNTHTQTNTDTPTLTILCFTVARKAPPNSLQIDRAHFFDSIYKWNFAISLSLRCVNALLTFLRSIPIDTVCLCCSSSFPCIPCCCFLRITSLFYGFAIVIDLWMTVQLVDLLPRIIIIIADIDTHKTTSTGRPLSCPSTRCVRTKSSPTKKALSAKSHWRYRPRTRP